MNCARNITIARRERLEKRRKIVECRSISLNPLSATKNIIGSQTAAAVNMLLWLTWLAAAVRKPMLLVVTERGLSNFHLTFWCKSASRHSRCGLIYPSWWGRQWQAIRKWHFLRRALSANQIARFYHVTFFFNNFYNYWRKICSLHAWVVGEMLSNGCFQSVVLKTDQKMAVRVSYRFNQNKPSGA